MRKITVYSALLLALLLLACHPHYGHCRDLPAVAKIPVGDVEVLAILDAPVTFEKAVIPAAADNPAIEKAFAAGPLPGVDRVFLFSPDGKKKFLVDAGWGSELPVKGNSLQVLESLGVKPEDITDILLTHLDYDHIGGLLRDGAPVFKNAALHVAEPELEAWINGTISKRPQTAVDLARRVATAYDGRINLINHGAEVFPGVRALAAPGHTPGHTAWEIASGDKKLTIAGDMAHVEAVQLAHPEASSIYDMDPAQAAATRREYFERAAKSTETFAGMHLPTIGRIQKDGAGYSLEAQQ